jgi:hypothetical protein
MTCGRRARAGGARAGGSMRVRQRRARAGDGAEEEGMTCGRCARAGDGSRGGRDRQIRFWGLGLWAVYCFMGLSLH